jgi:hypothetical protein
VKPGNLPKKKRSFGTMDKAKPNKENVRGLNLAEVKSTTLQFTKLPLYAAQFKYNTA